ncbi:WSC domain-containing protein [Aspergillus clavatus NRRL 1]|uniref:WSC domain protein, putative n=1 Tax=Aspergillus clavatus (strain ATCC 1007 / CBS 513.65 / DSM 816 / NCTC 3887 / NRRL 1 / QM 1276 / 107) TaxID=344612 RepID=A1CIT4_ASPCL|nr:WSC domain protein, putative [Aspergillus clavatus NRRL 1]EAW10789.1 WSC domain protein, putative [Aspergillus clavatus NRRL 1]
MKSFTLRSALTTSALLLAAVFPSVKADPTMVKEGCFSDATPLEDQGPYTYQSNGYCQTLCVKSNYLVFALTKGSNCLCGNQLPAQSAETTDDKCNVKCAGWPDVMCGGANAFSVYLTGISAKVPYYSSAPESTNSSSTSTTIEGSTMTTGSQGQIVTAGEQTVFVTSPANQAGTTISADPEKKQSDGGPNTAAIAAGVVVGVVGFCSLVGAGFFLWRFRKRSNAQPQYNANAERFGKPMSQDSMSDSRFDGDFMAQRRQSNGSIDDDHDFSRRILQVKPKGSSPKTVVADQMTAGDKSRPSLIRHTVTRARPYHIGLQIESIPAIMFTSKLL